MSFLIPAQVVKVTCLWDPTWPCAYRYTRLVVRLVWLCESVRERYKSSLAFRKLAMAVVSRNPTYDARAILFKVGHCVLKQTRDMLEGGKPAIIRDSYTGERRRTRTRLTLTGSRATPRHGAVRPNKSASCPGAGGPRERCPHGGPRVLVAVLLLSLDLT